MINSWYSHFFLLLIKVLSIISEIEVIGGDCFYKSAVVFCEIFGVAVPKIIFYAWEKCKLGEVGKLTQDYQVRQKKISVMDKQKFITYMNVFGNPIASSSGVDRIEIDSRQNEV
ncbi:hypothetical protein [Avibacterium gallinarum]|uniref:hypothetical protein n=1 Tax=Avibacterium gallinarum TaxID=755 RepID=UPI001C498DDA|nr:hypothetical protein [Avibacterium gallinarum]